MNVKGIMDSDLNHLKDSYRKLQGELIELQVDIDAVRTDRDGLLIDLRNIKEQTSRSEHGQQELRVQLQQVTKSAQLAERELNDLRVLLKKKEDKLEHLLDELTDEKQSRASAEHAYHTRTKEFLAKFDSMKEENKSLNNTLEMSDVRFKTVGEEQTEMRDMLEKLRGLLDQSRVEYKQHKEVEYELLHSIDEIKKELNTALSPIAVQEQVNNAKNSFSGHLMQQQQDLINVQQERDYLHNVIAQKDQQIQQHQQQTEWTIQMLQQRCSVIENEAKAAAEEDYKRLYRNLQELFAKEGQVVRSDLMDTQKLTNLIKELREKVLQNEFLQRDFDREKAVRKELEKQLNEAAHKVNEQSNERNNLNFHLNNLNMQLERLKVKSQPSSPFHNNFGKSSKSRPGKIEYDAISVEVRKLQDEQDNLLKQLNETQKISSKLRNELANSDDKAQQELSSLWVSVQELNKVDEAKDKKIDDLIRERNKAIGERDYLTERLKLSMGEAVELRKEMELIDKDLLTTVKTRRSPTKQNNPNHSRDNSPQKRDMFSELPGSPNRFVEETDDQLSEQLLQRQIEELSDFLIDEEKLKRNRIQALGLVNNSNSSIHGSAARVSKRNRLNTPLTKSSFY